MALKLWLQGSEQASEDPCSLRLKELTMSEKKLEARPEKQQKVKTVHRCRLVIAYFTSTRDTSVMTQEVAE